MDSGSKARVVTTIGQAGNGPYVGIGSTLPYHLGGLGSPVGIPKEFLLKNYLCQNRLVKTRMFEKPSISLRSVVIDGRPMAQRWVMQHRAVSQANAVT